MGRVKFAWAFLCLTAAFPAFPSERPLLADGGKSDYVIVVQGDAIPAEKTAAFELQSSLKAVTGALPPIVEAAPPGAKQIVLGPCPAFAAAFPDVDLSALKRDGIAIKTSGDALYLAGGRPRGTLYAVYTFLEDVVGCRWWSAEESFTPVKSRLELPELNIVYSPKLFYREAFYRGAFNPIYAARSKCNGHFEGIPEEYGSHYSLLGWCHTFYQLMPPDKYFKDHPEWYSEISGARTAEGAQLCLTNDEMRAEFVKNALEWLRNNPAAGIISIAQNDCGGNCQCAKCAAVEQEEGAPSGLLIRFVNSVAEEIGKEFPEVFVETLAYTYTRKAPALAKPAKNVLVRLCSIECCFSEPLETGPSNAEFKQDMESWRKIAPQLYVWDYVTNFSNYLLPHPNLRSLAPNIRFFVNNNTIGLFEQGDAGCSCSDFPELRAWLLAHLMWDPSRDDKALIHEFLTGYYGPAAPMLEEYINLINDAMEKSGACLHCFMASTSSWFGLDEINRAMVLFDEAQKSVESDPVLLKRVKRARMPLDHERLCRYYPLRRLALSKGESFSAPADPVVFCNDFINACNEFNAGSYAEGRPFAEYAELLKSRFRAPAPAPEICKSTPEQDWADIQDNEFSLAGSGDWAAIVDDSTASDGKAARMPANHSQWAVQYPISVDLFPGDSVHCYVYARCDAKADDGAAFQFGLYDQKQGQHAFQRVVSIAESRGTEYRCLDLGTHVLRTDMYVWLAPMNNPTEVDDVMIDRIVFVREK
jgi:hypothetical protein